MQPHHRSCVRNTEWGGRKTVSGYECSATRQWQYDDPTTHNALSKVALAIEGRCKRLVCNCLFSQLSISKDGLGMLADVPLPTRWEPRR